MLGGEAAASRTTSLCICVVDICVVYRPAGVLIHKQTVYRCLQNITRFVLAFFCRVWVLRFSSVPKNKPTF